VVVSISTSSHFTACPDEAAFFSLTLCAIPKGRYPVSIRLNASVYNWSYIAVQVLEISSSDKHLQELINRYTDVAFIHQSIDKGMIRHLTSSFCFAND